LAGEKRVFARLAAFDVGAARLVEDREPQVEAAQEFDEPLVGERLGYEDEGAFNSAGGEQALRGMQELRMLNRQTLAFFNDWDIYLSPVLGTPVPEVGFIDPVALEPRELNRRQGQVFPFTPPFNFSGQPSLSLPLEMSASGLPVGMMFTARYADEATLFRLAAQLEKEAPWGTRRPQIWG